MKLNPLPVEPARAALAALPVVAAQETLEPPTLAQVFVPQQHPKALSLESSIVVGMRGTGKSLWTAVLASDPHRAFVSELVNQPLLARVKARVGFGLDDTNELFPNAETIAWILSAGQEPYPLWQTVLLRHAAGANALEAPLPAEWDKAVAWTAANPGKAEALLTQYDRGLKEKGLTLLVLFDALDRLSTDWVHVRRLTLEALRLCLRCRSRRAIRLKFFLRPDLEEDPEIWKFPDSSKLRHAKVELSWRRVDLYALVLMHLVNSERFGKEFRAWLSSGFGARWIKRNGVYVLPQNLMAEDAALRPIVETLVDRHMGRDKKRGFTYTWIPTHLADAFGRISPRSYLLAFRRAAEMTTEGYPEHLAPLRYSAIQDGVIAASEIRVEEITEDYPWVKPLLEAARGLMVPLTPRELTRAWTPDCLQGVRAASAEKLPPRRFTTDPFRAGSVDALVDDLIELGVLYRTGDARVNMPDIFRVGFGIKRKGGVKPPR